MAEGLRFMSLSLVRLRTFQLSTWMQVLTQVKNYDFFLYNDNFIIK